MLSLLFALTVTDAAAGVVGKAITTSAPEFAGRDKSTIALWELRRRDGAH